MKQSVEDNKQEGFDALHQHSSNLHVQGEDQEESKGECFNTSAPPEQFEQSDDNGGKPTTSDHVSHESCKSCGSLADKCSCKDCECQVCFSKTRAGNSQTIEPPIKSATSSTIVCGGGCVAAAQRAEAGGCPACECPANCPCTKCGCPICGPTQSAAQPLPCCGGSEASKRATAGNCPACGCPASNCPCTGCVCPVCKSA
ncbi:unnamed protein product [Phytophthora fragariaefolia]|uniref:Unnamed protein product n=1 Tax=Phytophthora fragariaefolia TaxID=1490495 RepID=A0A9W6XU15_9STRA|nr:unnamed protein product [Phytophthora fragariaefolia]